MTSQQSNEEQPGQEALPLLLAAIRHERQHQIAWFDAINVVAAALLGLEGVLVALVPGVQAQPDWRTAGLWLLAMSILSLLTCLLDIPLSPCNWRRSRWPRFETHDALALLEYLETEVTDAAPRMYLNETVYVVQNRSKLLFPKRIKLIAAVILFAAAFSCIGIGALLR